MKIGPINKFILIPGEEREFTISLKMLSVCKCYNYIYIYHESQNKFMYNIYI